MKNLLISGLGLKNDFEKCYPCNYNHSWLIQYPSLLLWMDKFIIPKSIWNTIIDEKFPNTKELSKSYKLVFEHLDAKQMLQIIDTSEIFDKRIEEIIFNEIALDIHEISKIHPGLVSIENDPDNKDHKMIFIDGHSYCPPILWTSYMGLALSRALNAQCILNPSELHYFRFKFRNNNIPNELNPSNVESFRSIFNSFLPNAILFPEYSIENKERCNDCKKSSSCSDSYLLELEENIKKYLEWRDYDEIYQLKEIADKIIKENEKVEGFIDPQKVFADFTEKHSEIKKRIRLVFPQVKRWANLATITSIPIALFGLATQNPLITLSSASIAGISKISSEVISLFENKYRWIYLIPNKISD